MNNRDSLGDRMKRYENVNRYKLTPRSIVIIRCDGRAFHSYKFKKPFDNRMIEAMKWAANMTAEQMQGFKCGYVQSDEASFLLTDFDTFQTQGWFDYNLQKIVSISASLMTVYFVMQLKAELSLDECLTMFKKLPTFDARAFIVPNSDVTNYFLWRAKDWERNSLQMYAQSSFSHKELMNKGQADIHEMLHLVNKNWSTDLSPIERNGTFFTNKQTVNDVLPNYESIETFMKLAISEAMKMLCKKGD